MRHFKVNLVLDTKVFLRLVGNEKVYTTSVSTAGKVVFSDETGCQLGCGQQALFFFAEPVVAFTGN